MYMYVLYIMKSTESSSGTEHIVNSKHACQAIT